MTLSVAEALVLGAAAVAAIGVAARSPFHAFCVLLVALPFESALALRAGLTITPAYLALIVTVIQMGRFRRRVQLEALTAPAAPLVLAYLAAAALSLIMTIVVAPPMAGGASGQMGWRLSEYRSVTQFAFLCFSASAFFVTIGLCSTAERLRFATRVFIVVSALTALYGLFQMAGVWYRTPLVGPSAHGLFETPASLRPNATFQEAMNFGHFLIAALSVLTALHLHASAHPRAERLIYGPAAIPMLAVMATALLLTIGRAAWLGFGVAAVIILIGSERPARLRALGLGVVAGLAAVAFARFTFGSLDVLVATVANRFQFDAHALTTEQRTWYFPFLVRLFLEYPALGVGYGNYPLYQVFAFRLWGIAGAYGVFWQALVETGIVGLSALLILIVGAVRGLILALSTTRRPEWRPHLVGWLAALCGLSTSYFFFGDRFSLYMWVALGLAMATVRQARKPVEAV